jgi:hypothetical protein
MRHHLGEALLVAGDVLGDGRGDVVRRFRDDGLDGALDVDRLAGGEAELGRRLRRCMG